MDNSSSSSSSSTSSSSFSSFSSLEEMPIHMRKERVLQDRIDENAYDDEEFKRRFRFSKTGVTYITSLIAEKIKHADNRGVPLTPTQQVLLALRYYATGSFQIVAGDLIGVHQSTACIVIHRVSRALAELRRDFIKMPITPNEITNTTRNFYKIKQIPRCIGVIDGCHVPIRSPGGNDAELYRNRKGFFSINVQAICDSNCKFQDIVARWHGSAHDQTVFNFSHICARLENGEFGNSLLIGDSGYGCKNYLITPYRNPSNLAEEKYNKAICSTRVVIERTFGLWKRRFPAVSTASQLELDNFLVVIIATAVLHNIAIECNEDDTYLNEDFTSVYPEVPTARALREYNTSTETRNIITQLLSL